MKKKKILAVIPARGNSKGIRKKNLAILKDKPLIYYTINEAKKTNLITDLIVSTEDVKIAKISNKYKCSTPFLRPKKLSKDDTKTFPVVLHALKFMENQNKKKYDLILLLQPTSPLRKKKDIEKSINILVKNYKRYDSLVSLVSVGAHHPFRMKVIKKNFVKNFIDQGFEDMRPRQKLPKIFIRNGAIYLIKRNSFLKNKSLVGKKVYPYLMNDKNSINIDDKIGLKLANTLLSK
tara:strand:+ start:2100 stop:2804 length:705 start_codon:yes stop_codon:yes gene_type:complete